MLCSLKEIRTNLGFSQVRLAYESKVSLPTIQNIEAQKANPTLDVLEKLFQTLGLEIVIRPIPIDIEKAIALGVPLTSSEKRTKSMRPTSTLLKEEALKWNYALFESSVGEREKLAIIGFIMAIKDHYPTFYHDEICFDVFERNIEIYKNDGKVIKLRRMSLNHVSKYL